jgi:hypothetical protein
MIHTLYVHCCKFISTYAFVVKSWFDQTKRQLPEISAATDLEATNDVSQIGIDEADVLESDAPSGSELTEEKDTYQLYSNS